MTTKKSVKPSNSQATGSQLNPEMKCWVIDMQNKCLAQIEKHDCIQMTWPRRRNSIPPGFPKGEFVAGYDDVNAYAYRCSEVIEWCESVLLSANDRSDRRGA